MHILSKQETSVTGLIEYATVFRNGEHRFVYETQGIDKGGEHSSTH